MDRSDDVRCGRMRADAADRERSAQSRTALESDEHQSKEGRANDRTRGRDGTSRMAEGWMDEIMCRTYRCRDTMTRQNLTACGE